MKNIDNKKLIIDNHLSENLKSSFEEVISMFLMSPANLISQIDEITTPLHGNRVTIGIYLNGDLEGSIFLTMDVDVAKKIVSLMTMEENIEELNELHESALREMLNMISGTFVSKISNLINPYSNDAYFVDISSPICILSNSNISIWIDKMSNIKEFVFEVENIGQIVMYLGFKSI